MIGRFLFFHTKHSYSVLEILIILLILKFIYPVFSGELNWIGYVLLISSMFGCGMLAAILNCFINAFAVDLMKRAHMKKQFKKLSDSLAARKITKGGDK